MIAWPDWMVQAARAWACRRISAARAACGYWEDGAHRWHVERGISTPGPFLYAGCACGATVYPAERTGERDCGPNR
jgi:hypothetical protein